jgi:hypothetical protein
MVLLSESRGVLSAYGARLLTVHVERHDVVYADAKAWWTEQCTHGGRLTLERMDERGRAAYAIATG